MSMHRALGRGVAARGTRLSAGLGIAGIVVLAALWLVTLVHAPGESGSLDARVTAVGATVRCPFCKEPIPLNDVQSQPALQMRQFIRRELQRGQSEDAVRRELVTMYGPSILLEPPGQGFNLLAWAVPLIVVAGCAVALLLAIRRWSRAGASELVAPPLSPAEGGVPLFPGAPDADARRYEALLDRELAGWDP